MSSAKSLRYTMHQITRSLARVWAGDDPMSAMHPTARATAQRGFSANDEHRRRTPIDRRTVGRGTRDRRDVAPMTLPAAYAANARARREAGM